MHASLRSLFDEVFKMPIDDQEQRAIHFLAQRIRRQTSGCGPWDDHGLAANIAKIANRSLHMTIEHVLRHAADPSAKSPGVLLGSFTPQAPTSSGAAHAPKRHEQCSNCSRRLPCGCGHNSSQPVPAADATARARALEAARAVLGAKEETR